jgi:hypothetical protein
MQTFYPMLDSIGSIENTSESQTDRTKDMPKKEKVNASNKEEENGEAKTPPHQKIPEHTSPPGAPRQSQSQKSDMRMGGKGGYALFQL